MGEDLVSLWRVQVLPLGTVRYRVRDLNLTPEYLEAIAEAFSAGVFDIVPFQIADMHTNDPTCFRGEARELEVVADGMDAVIAATPEGDEAIRTTPGLAAAPRLFEDYRTADGRTWPVALQHILGTTQPIITGLRPWRELEPSS